MDSMNAAVVSPFHGPSHNQDLGTPRPLFGGPLGGVQAKWWALSHRIGTGVAPSEARHW